MLSYNSYTKFLEDVKKKRQEYYNLLAVNPKMASLILKSSPEKNNVQFRVSRAPMKYMNMPSHLASTWVNSITSSPYGSQCYVTTDSSGYLMPFTRSQLGSILRSSSIGRNFSRRKI